MALKFNAFTGNFDITEDISNLVTGPASAADNRIARFDGTTGKLVQNSSASISDSGVITAGADGVASLDLVTKQQLDASINGVDVKEGVLVSTTANITLIGEQTIDGVLTSSSRVLVKSQSLPSQNGIYVSNAGAWTRSSDADSTSDLNDALVCVESGSTFSNTGWRQTTIDPVVGVDSIVWNQFFGAGTYTADGNGIELSGSTFQLELDSSTLSKSSSGLKVATGGITNTEVNASAGIVYSKLNLSNSILNADINAAAAIAYSKLALTNSIVNADVSSSAAIALSKLATTTAGFIPVGATTTGILTAVQVTGDVTLSSSGAVTIASGVISNAKLASMNANTIKGNNTGSSGQPLDLTTAQAQSLLGIPTTSSPLALDKGGTGTSAASANAAFNALSPMTTSGDIIYGGTSGAGTRLAKGSDGQVLTLASGLPSWAAAASGSATMNVTASKTANYTAVANDFVPCNATSAGFAVTLPTAVGISGQRIVVKKTDSTVNDVTINTTSSQTYDNRASGTIVLNTQNAFASFISNGTNWYIDGKFENSLSTASSSGTTTLTGRSDGDYLTASADLTLTPGVWKVRGYFSIRMGTGTDCGVYPQSGLYSTDGGNSASAPTALASGTNVKAKFGDETLANSGAAQTYAAFTSSGAINLRVPAGFVEAIVVIDGGNQTIYSVPRAAVGTAGTADINSYIRAERVW